MPINDAYIPAPKLCAAGLAYIYMGEIRQFSKVREVIVVREIK